MTYRLIVRPLAESDLADTFAWYESRREGLGRGFQLAVDEAFDRIQLNPFAYPKVEGEVRRAVLKRFPYNIFYLIRDNDVIVLGVIHGHRDPQVWKSKISRHEE